ncbi:MAG: flagellar hook-basal body complex protein FliE [Syntrophobacterales bacterium]|nr:MAG: flagellar hook-basal body complex protein FliE [Syntrophobacterales bacterium]
MNEIGLVSGMGEKAGWSLPMKDQSEGSGVKFGELLQASLDRVGQLQTAADQSVADLESGRQADIHSTMIAVEKAGIAFEMALTIRNKLLTAYESIMRTQI